MVYSFGPIIEKRNLMNCMEEEYLKMLRHIMKHGVDRDDRTGHGTRSVFAYTTRYDLSKGFPLLTTKKMSYKMIFDELLWFLSGDTHIAPLVEKGIGIWNGDAYKAFTKSEDFAGETFEEFAEKLKTNKVFLEKHGALGPIYGAQWRNFGGVDQIKRVIESIKKSPHSRRHIVMAWNPAQVEEMVLPPCHVFFQFYVENNRLSLVMFQRSGDAFLGIPFNIASYSALLMMIAQVTGLEPGEFVHVVADLHVYKNHFDAVEEQLARSPLPPPRLKLNPEVDDIFAFTPEDFEIVDYESHPAIRARLNAETIVEQVIGH